MGKQPLRRILAVLIGFGCIGVSGPAAMGQEKHRGIIVRRSIQTDFNSLKFGDLLYVRIELRTIYGHDEGSDNLRSLQIHYGLPSKDSAKPEGQASVVLAEAEFVPSSQGELGMGYERAYLINPWPALLKKRGQESEVQRAAVRTKFSFLAAAEPSRGLKPNEVFGVFPLVAHFRHANPAERDYNQPVPLTLLMSIEGVAIEPSRLGAYYRMDHTSVGALAEEASELTILPKELGVELANCLNYSEHLDKECEELEEDSTVWRLLKVIQLLNRFELTPREHWPAIDQDLGRTVQYGGRIEQLYLTHLIARTARTKGWSLISAEDNDPAEHPGGLIPIEGAPSPFGALSVPSD